jgi:hypothetical protein
MYWAEMRIVKQGLMEQLKTTKCKQKNCMTLEKGVMKKKNHNKSGIKIGGDYSSNRKRGI